MNDFFLKFDSEEQAKNVLYSEDKPLFKNIDVIGTIYVPSQNIDEEGNPIMEAVQGYHVNIRSLEDEDTTMLEPFSLVPNHPVRVWG